MNNNLGWIGSNGQVLYYLSTVNADKNEEGKYIIGNGGVFLFLGIDNENNDAVINSEAVYYCNKQPHNLAAGLRQTSMGMGIVVF